MRLGYQTNGLQNHRLPDAFALLAEHGFTAVGITPDVGHLDPERTTEADLAQAAASLREHGLLPVMETGARYVLDPRQKHEPTLMTRDPAARARRLAYTARTAAFGARLGAQVVSFWAGIDRQPSADSHTWMLDGIRRSCEAIRAAGLQPSLEPEPGMAVATVDDWFAVRQALGGDAPALTLDIGHLYVDRDPDPAATIAKVAPFLAQVHLEDMRTGVHEHLLPGTGDVDFGAVLTALQRAGYQGPVCFELSRSSHLGPDALRACKAVWERARPGMRR